VAPRLALRPRRAARRAAERRAAALAAGAVVAATGFGALAAASRRRATAPVDEEVRRRAAEAGSGPVARHVLAAPLPLGKWHAYLPLAVGAAAYVLRARGGRGHSAAGARAVVLAGLLPTALGPAFDRWLPQPPAPPGHPSPRDPVFPSGHTLGPGSVALAAAYVLAREGLLHAGIGVPAAFAMPLVTAGGKLTGQKHWASDVVGGYLGALAVAGACLAAYERAAAGPARPRRRPRPR
jgi:membrane-associated phospholipid phosphatase